ncbi:MAG: Na+/H+ antiporter subunit E [Pseudomonadales bacterium]
MLLAAIWLLLTGGDPKSWLIGVPLVLGTSIAGQLFSKTPPRHWSLIGILRFVPYFLWGSLRGATTTAVLVLTRPRRLEPVVVEYKTTLPLGLPLALFVGVIGLLPGTLVADVKDNLLQIHVLDVGIPIRSELQELERRVAAMLITGGQELL